MNIANEEDFEQQKEHHIFLIALITENEPLIIKFYDLKKGVKIGELNTYHHEQITCFIKTKDNRLLTGSKDKKWVTADKR